MLKRLAILVLLGATAPVLSGPPRVTDVPSANDQLPDLKKTESKYYFIHTDLDPTETREVALRLTAMAEEYATRTKSFAGTIKKKFPVFLFRKLNDYYAAGGMPGTAGCFNPNEECLLISVGMEANAGTWHTMQHEGFHQFAYAVIGGDLPTWVNEGLAEYFGEGIWTGDNFVTGVIPEWRLQRIRQTMSRDGFMPVADVMGLSLSEWNSDLAIEHYDQAWSMVHFLVHGDGGKYRKAFSAYMSEVGKGRPSSTAWKNAFGDTDGFQQRWVTYWKDLPENPTADTYNQATVATLASFWGRAIARKQTIADYDAFTTAAREKKLNWPIDAPDWLPQSLLADALATAGDAGEVKLDGAAKGSSRVILTRKDGCRAIATITMANGKIKSIATSFDDTPRALAEAKRLQILKESAKANALLKDALKRNPDSPSAEEARQLLGQPAPQPKPTK